MIEATFDIDLEDVLDGFDDMKRRARDLTPAWREIAEDMKKDIREHGKRKEGPEGRWERLAKSTLKRRRALRKRGGKKKPAVAILGKIRTAFSIEWGPKFIRAVSKIWFSSAHQDGAVVGKGIKLPARPLFWVSDAFMDILVAAVLKHITRVF